MPETTHELADDGELTPEADQLQPGEVERTDAVYRMDGSEAVPASHTLEVEADVLNLEDPSCVFAAGAGSSSKRTQALASRVAREYGLLLNRVKVERNIAALEARIQQERESLGRDGSDD